jgi:SAM-dependent methyltransferase
MSDQALSEFYAEEYRQLYQGNAEPGVKDLQIQRLRAAALLAFIQPHLPSLHRHLDIGCSAGLLLQAFQAHYDCQPRGIEPGEAYRRYAQDQGLLVHPSLDDLLATLPDRFDLISLAHVLEHLSEPIPYLTQLQIKLLAPDGWLLVEVPNLYCHDSFEVAHLASYSPHTLQQALRLAGYDVIYMEQHGRPHSDILPLYITVLARPNGQPTGISVTLERNVRWKRRLGLLRRALLSKLAPRRAWKQV